MVMDKLNISQLIQAQHMLLELNKDMLLLHLHTLLEMEHMPLQLQDMSQVNQPQLHIPLQSSLKPPPLTNMFLNQELQLLMLKELKLVNHGNKLTINTNNTNDYLNLYDENYQY